jgi:excisionase family DNA binding protein
MADDLLTADDVAEWLGVARGSVNAWLCRGRLRGTRLGGPSAGWRDRAGDVEHFMDAHSNRRATPVER